MYVLILTDFVNFVQKAPISVFPQQIVKMENLLFV